MAKKKDAAPAAPRHQNPPDTVTVTLELPAATYAQIEGAARLCGLSVQEWFDDIIRDKV